MARAFVRKALIMASLAALAAPAAAQIFSDGYEFLKAVKDRDGEAVTNALNEPGSVVVNTRDKANGETALHIVTKRRDVTWIKFLSQRGANPNIADRNGVTPLVLAVNLGFVEGVEELLKAGADVDVSNDAGETPLISSVHRRDTALMRLLLENGANPDRTDNSGRSARDYVALMNGNTILVDLLNEHDKKASEESDAAQQTYGPSF